MRKLWKQMGICACIAVIVLSVSVLSDRRQLREELIRFHVVANSDAPQDQAIKLRVRDAVLDGIRSDLEQAADLEAAKAYLMENLPKIEAIARETLAASGVSADAVVSLCKEAFDTRYYETFTLPAGVYDSLRITIGDGAGKNWWCVAFPSLCLPASTDDVAEVAAAAGFSETLTGAITGREAYEVRFFLLDALGELENILFNE